MALEIVVIPLLVLLCIGMTNRHYRRFARRLEAGMSVVQTAREPTNTVLIRAESIDTATEGALWYGRTICHEGKVRALLAPGTRTDPAVAPRWFDFAEEDPRLDRDPQHRGRTRTGAPRGGSGGYRVAIRYRLTVVIPEQFQAAAHFISAAGRTSFRLKSGRLAAGSRGHPRARRHVASNSPREDGRRKRSPCACW